jgi:carboxyl-terminal processing protease
LPGDKVLRINEESTEGLSLQEAVQKIRGPNGTSVELTVLRGEETKEIAISRETIRVPVLEWEIKEGNVAYIRLFSFSEEAAGRVRNVMRELQSRRPGPAGIVFDLRNNPGGYLEVSQEVVGWFVEPNSTVAIEDFGDAREDRIYSSVGNGEFRNTPMVVIINEGSASASEIMAGALRDLRGVQLVGEKSFGKGSIQELFSLSGGSSVKITIAKWLTPNGESIAERGLEPDVVVERTAEDIEADRDPQLEKALEVLNPKPYESR